MTELIWETATDWDNAVSENHVDHLSDGSRIRLGFFDDFESDLSEWSTYNASLDTSRVARGSQSVYLGNNESWIYHDFPTSQDIIYFESWVNYQTGGRFEGPEVFDTDADNGTDGFWDNSTLIYYDGNNRNTIFSGSADTWYLLKLKYDSVNDNLEFTIEDINNNTVNSGTLNFSSNTANQWNRFIWGQINQTARDDAWVDDTWIVWESNGTLTTSTKSFSSSTKVDLTNLDYSLNGQSITVDVIGSPGTSDEEIVSQTLDGSTSYSPTWSQFHTDYRVQVNLNTDNKSTSPTFSSITLESQVSAPSTPQNLTSTVSQDDITLDWDAVSWNGDEGHYDIKEAETSGGPYTEITTVASGTTIYTVTALEDGEQFFYVVEADNSVGGSGNSNETSEITVLPAPSNVDATQL